MQLYKNQFGVKMTKNNRYDIELEDCKFFPILAGVVFYS